MLDLEFTCLGARPAASAAPTMLLTLRVDERSGRHVYAMGLRCQIRVEPIRRRYSEAEAERLFDLFGERCRWHDTVLPFHVASVATMTQGFTDTTTFDLALPCTYDTEVAWAKYFQALGDGDIPLLLLFSGSVFFREDGGMLVEQVPWDCETRFALPVATWRALMDAHFPGTSWLRLQSGTVEALQRYRRARMLVSWEDTFATLLQEAGAEQP